MALEVRIARAIENVQKAQLSLVEALQSPITEARDLAGIIKCFELVFETAWRALQKIAIEQQLPALSPKQALEAGFQLRLIEDEKAWIKIKDDWNDTVHVYNQELAKQMVDRIRSQHVKAFASLVKNLEQQI